MSYYISPYIFNDNLFYSCFIFTLKNVFVHNIPFYVYCILIGQIETKLPIDGQNFSEFELIFCCVETKQVC